MSLDFTALDALDFDDAAPAAVAEADAAVSFATPGHGTQGTFMGGVEGSGIFGGVTAPELGAVGLAVLSQGEFGVSDCGGCIGDKKKQDRMCIKSDCAVVAHKNNPWKFFTSLVSPSEGFVFICVKGRE